MGLAESITLPDTALRARIDVERGVLVGSRCSQCGATAWPSRAICHRCGAPAMREAPFASVGSLLAVTTVWVARPGLEAPYLLGQIELVDGPIVFGHVRGLEDDNERPSRMRLVVAAAGSMPPFWFQPEDDA